MLSLVVTLFYFFHKNGGDFLYKSIYAYVCIYKYVHTYKYMYTLKFKSQ